MAGRVLSCLSFAFMLIAVNSEWQDQKTAPPEQPCKTCRCENSKLNCHALEIKTFFSKEKWNDLSGFNPTIVDLSNNYIEKVTVIAELSIEILNLSRNQIEFIENASFKDLQNLRVLDLSHNKLTAAKLSPHAFEGRYSPEDYEPLLKMRTLNLAYNDLKSLQPDLFEHLPELTELDLSGNLFATLDHVTVIAMSSLPSLRILRMRSCQLTAIPDMFLHTPRFLERLDLSNNQLSAVPQELKETKNLVYLNLNQNPISELDMNSEDHPGFPRLPKLEELRMCHMPSLLRIGAGALAGLENLTRLHLSFNPKLAFIDPKVMARFDDIEETYAWPPITELYLNNNNISGINWHFLERWELLTDVDFSNNPYVCDCNNQWMVDVLVPLIMGTAANGSGANMFCQEPQRLRGLTFVQLYQMSKTLVCPDGENGENLVTDCQKCQESIDTIEMSEKGTWMYDELCDDKYRTERNSAFLLGCLFGVLVSMAISLFLVLLWRRGYLARIGLLDSKEVSGALYKRAPADDNYM